MSKEYSMLLAHEAVMIITMVPQVVLSLFLWELSSDLLLVLFWLGL